MQFKTAKKLIKKYLDLNVHQISSKYSSLCITPFSVLIFSGNHTEKITALLHEAGHYLHCKDYWKYWKCKHSKRSEAFNFIHELQAWKRAFILAHVLSIPISASAAKEWIATYWEHLPMRYRKKFERFYNTI